MKILIVRLGALGDVPPTLPVVMALRAARPAAELHWLAAPGPARLLAGHPAVDHIVLLRRSFAGYRAAWREIRLAYDWAIDTQGLLKSAFMARSASARVIGRAPGFARERLASRFYSDPVVPRGEHVIEQNLSLLAPLSIQADKIEYGLTFPRVEWPLLDRRPVLFNIGGGWWTKLWPIERFAALARRIDAELRLPVGVLWGPGEEADAARIAGDSPAEKAPPTTFLEIGDCCRRARLLVSGETGPLHVAVAAKCPTVALLGPTAASRNGPFGAGHAVVEPPLDCRPCHARSCADFRCMPAITVDQVFAAVARQLSRDQGT